MSLRASVGTKPGKPAPTGLPGLPGGKPVLKLGFGISSSINPHKKSFETLKNLLKSRKIG
jgi:hypothetical protein